MYQIDIDLEAMARDTEMLERIQQYDARMLAEAHAENDAIVAAAQAAGVTTDAELAPIVAQVRAEREAERLADAAGATARIMDAAADNDAAADERGPRDCPTCKAKNVLSRYEASRGYQCRACTRRDESPY